MNWLTLSWTNIVANYDGEEAGLAFGSVKGDPFCESEMVPSCLVLSDSTGCGLKMKSDHTAEIVLDSWRQRISLILRESYLRSAGKREHQPSLTFLPAKPHQAIGSWAPMEWLQ